MGRAFEYRKATKLKRWGHMARTFTKLGKEITIAAREGGADPDGNPRLRMLIQQCKRENMPKENIDRAIKKATDKSAEGYKEINYEGYGPHGIAIFIETATDNHMRTVANIRSYFTKHGGNLGTQGCLQFLFDRKACFTITRKDDVDLDELELELIDFGVEELGVDEEENTIVIYSDFDQYSGITYGRASGYDQYRYFTTQTPGGANSGTSFERRADPVEFSVPGGAVQAGPITVSLSAEEGMGIYYTTDGSEPTSASSRYTQPITLNETTVLRAVAWRQDCLPSVSNTTTKQSKPSRRTPSFRNLRAPAFVRVFLFRRFLDTGRGLTRT